MYELMKSNDFNRKLAVAGHSVQETNKLFEELLFDAFHQALPVSEGGHGSCQRLTACIGMAEHTKGLNVRKMQAFIQAHADVKWTRNSNGTHSFSFRDKPSVTLPTVTWYDWKHGSDKAAVEVDVMKQIKTLLRKAEKEGSVVKDDKNILPRIKEMCVNSGIQWDTGKKKPAAGKQKANRQPA